MMGLEENNGGVNELLDDVKVIAIVGLVLSLIVYFWRITRIKASSKMAEELITNYDWGKMYS